MSRKTDLEGHIRQSYKLIREFEDILRLSDNPKEQARARRAIEEQWELIKGYLAEYVPLCGRLSLTMPEDIAEIVVIAGVPFPSVPSAQPPSEPALAPSATVPAGSLPNAHALLIGIGAYRHLRPLAKTTTDARDLHDLLAQSGYPAANLALLLDAQATKAAISDRLDWLARRTGPDDTVVLFFSGHGAQRVGGFEPGEYLCPVEADWYNLQATAISDEELTTALRAIPARRVVVFLDACHSGGVGEPKDASLAVKPGLSEAAYERLATGEGRVVIASCKPDEVSWELPEMRNGLFTHYLLEALRGAAAIRGDGFVRIYDVAHYVQEQVPRRQPDQHPLFKGADIDTNFPIALTIGGREAARPPFEPQMITIPAGPFLMGTLESEIAELVKLGMDSDWIKHEIPQSEITLPVYAISRYPVTNAEFARFIEDGGYQNRDYWTKAGWRQKEREGWTRPRYWEDEALNEPTQPVVGVSWYEALAYCRWLADVTDKPYRLPSEAEWEKAARGTDGRRYPWGNEWDASHCNNRESGPGCTTSVGEYPEGDSPYGVGEMVGQIWEWCNSKQAGYPYDPDDGREATEGIVNRILRGGSWWNENPAAWCRCTVRIDSVPGIRYEWGGFRCAITLPSLREIEIAK